MLSFLKFTLIGLCSLNVSSLNDIDSIKEVADINGLLTFVKGYRVAIVDQQLSGALEATRDFLTGQQAKQQVTIPPYTIAVIASPGVTKGVFLELGAPLTGYIQAPGARETGGAGAALDVQVPSPHIGIP